MDSAALRSVHGGVTLGGTRVGLVDRARLYACGITPYDVTHLGHAATFVWVDVLRRVLRFSGLGAELCRNVTDVDDVLDDAAARAGKDYDWFAAVGQFDFDTDMAALGVRAPQHEPRAHRYIPEVIRLAANLVSSGAAYVADGSVYFHGRAVPARVGLEEAEALRLLADFGDDPEDRAKNDPLDVPIWRASGPNRTGWESPWGRGRPGWHAECVAMSLSVFGVGVDIHAGGADLRFPHHAFHAAMAEALTAVVPYARAWFHVGTVSVDGAKMAKSAGNLVMVSDLLAEHRAAHVRMMILDRPWAAGWDYTGAARDAAGARLDALYGAARRNRSENPPAEARLVELLCTELDVPAALDLAIEEGGRTAQLLTGVLGLS
jgi:cysteinyl-tRNA synthetase